MAETRKLNTGQARVKPLSERGKSGVRLCLQAGFTETERRAPRMKQAEDRLQLRRAETEAQSAAGDFLLTSQGTQVCLLNAQRLKCLHTLKREKRSKWLFTKSARRER
ncbi:hypothetical protein NDU88_002517 [Pleurodeles waltl]|uniref:Uncharacterized protein n=1 Tax=Pleurodeles waltl TaxID=8319 RepID=A0AAV7MRQ7_PLEWA|nr:hypothetical protein NDU88_002517 [Pleurodeles waltl]